jgi:hypothetical protein
MVSQGLPLAGLLTGGFSIALGFAPFFLPFPQLAVGLGVGLLVLALATGIHATWWVRRKAKPAVSKPLPVPKAA